MEKGQQDSNNTAGSTSDDRGGARRLSSEASSSASSRLRLHQAAVDGQDARVRELIQQGEVVNAQDHDGNTPLHLALINRRPEVVNLLMRFHQHGPSFEPPKNRRRYGPPLEKGEGRKREECKTLPPPAYDQLFQTSTGASEGLKFVDLHAPNAKGETPLVLAVRDKNVSTVHGLLEAGAEPDFGAGQLPLPVHTAAQYGDLMSTSILKDLLKHGGQVNTLDHQGLTPLMVACRNSNLVTVKTLLGHPAQFPVDLSFKHPTEGTVLHCAARVGNQVIIDTLLERGAELYTQDAQGSLPLLEALRFKSYSCVKSLLKRGVDRPVPHILRLLTHFTGPDETLRDMVKGVLESQPRALEDSGPKSPYGHVIGPGYTALHFCVTNESPKLCSLLLEYKAPVNIRTVRSGDTPLQLAVHDFVTKSRDQSQSGSPITAESAQNDVHIQMIKVLLNFGADVNSCNGERFTAFHECARFEDEICGKLLMYAGANPESCDVCVNNKHKRTRYHQHWGTNPLPDYCGPFAKLLRKGDLLPLQFVCRLKVRQRLFANQTHREDMVSSVASAIEQLPLPQRLKHFLL